MNMRHSNHFNTCKYSGGERLSKMSQDKPWGLRLTARSNKWQEKPLEVQSNSQDVFGYIPLPKASWFKDQKEWKSSESYTNCRGEHEAALQIIFHTDLVQLAWIHSFSLECKPARLPTTSLNPKPPPCFYQYNSFSLELAIVGSQAKKLDPKNMGIFTNHIITLKKNGHFTNHIITLQKLGIFYKSYNNNPKNMGILEIIW